MVEIKVCIPEQQEAQKMSKQKRLQGGREWREGERVEGKKKEERGRREGGGIEEDREGSK
jgi:hypothetical protein